MATQTKTLKKKEEEKIELSTVDKAEIEKSFAESKDFREVWEKITAPIDNIIKETAQVIDNDPVMNVSEELWQMNNEVQWVYSDIIDNDGKITKFFKKIPLIWDLVQTLDDKIDQAKFDMKWIQGKIEIIFSWFDTTYNSVNKSIDLQIKFLDTIEKNLWKIEAYKDFIEDKLLELQKSLLEM